MRFWFVMGGVLIVGVALASLGWSFGMRWVLDRYLDDVDTWPSPAEPVEKFTGFDPALRERTALRRLAADSIRKRASHVETGAQIADVLRLVK